jgi:hypothetical protein
MNIDARGPIDLDKDAIDELTRAFFGSLSNVGGVAPNLIVIKNINALPVVYTGGSLVDFSEEETSERTDIFANIAQRFSCYKKSWKAHGVSFSGGGTNSFQFVRTSTGWKIASVVWDDN